MSETNEKNEKSPLLELKGIHIHYGLIHAIKGIDLRIYPGEIVTILGANGAGKTTTLHSISGLVPSSRGEIIFEGQSIKNNKSHEIVKLGIAQSPEGRMVFPNMSVKENLEMGAYLRKQKLKIKRDQELVFELFPRLKERLKQQAGTLSGGEQQMLAIARAFMANPKLLLLDEPSLGIAPILVQAIFKTIQEINQRGTTILLVEQNAYAALKIAHRGHVLSNGRITMSGSAKDLMADKEIQKAYLGQ